MIKLIHCLRKREHLSLAEFQSHWLQRHARFGRDNPAVRRYVQYHRLEDDPIMQAMKQAGGTVVEPYDGVDVSWWDDLASLQREMAAPRTAAVLEDARHFIDPTRSTACVAQERVIFEPEEMPQVVLFECLRRPSGIDHDEFSSRWYEHRKIGERSRQTGILKGYIQNVSLLAEPTDYLAPIGGNAPYDGITMAYFESVAKMKTLLAAPLVTVDAYEDECRFMDHKRCAYLVTQRHVIRDLCR